MSVSDGCDFEVIDEVKNDDKTIGVESAKKSTCASQSFVKSEKLITGEKFIDEGSHTDYSPTPHLYSKFTFQASEATENPYFELICSYEYSSEQLQITKVPPIKPLDETPSYVIETKVELIKLLQLLRNEAVIALDLVVEHCNEKKKVHFLIVSTLDADYIIDVPPIKIEVLLLNEIFINPKILKIVSFAYHKYAGCLQHALCLYAINVFDVWRGAEIVHGVLSSSIYDVIEKVFQTKIQPTEFVKRLFNRPVLPKVQDFFRVHTRYLIPLYHKIKNDLLERGGNSYQIFLNECRERTKVVHVDDEMDAFRECERILKENHKAQLEALEKMYAWRQNTAKIFKKPPSNVLSKKDLIAIAQYLPLDWPTVNNITQSQFVKNDAVEIFAVLSGIKAGIGGIGKKNSGMINLFTLPDKVEQQMGSAFSKTRKREGRRKLRRLVSIPNVMQVNSVPQNPPWQEFLNSIDNSPKKQFFPKNHNRNSKRKFTNQINSNIIPPFAQPTQNNQSLDSSYTNSSYEVFEGLSNRRNDSFFEQNSYIGEPQDYNGYQRNGSFQQISVKDKFRNYNPSKTKVFQTNRNNRQNP